MELDTKIDVKPLVIKDECKSDLDYGNYATAISDLKQEIKSFSDVYREQGVSEKAVFDEKTFIKQELEYDWKEEKPETIKTNERADGVECNAFQPNNFEQTSSTDSQPLSSWDQLLGRDSTFNVLEQIRLSGRILYRCGICDCLFSNQNSLMFHMKNIHTKESRSQCQQSILQGSNLTAQNNNVIASEPCLELVSVSFRVNQGETEYEMIYKEPFGFMVCRLRAQNKCHTSFQCKICHKSFTKRKYLNWHAKIHTAERLFKCNICEKSFTFRNYLKQHQQSHAEEKPFQCSMCEKSFARKSQMKEHEIIHTREKLFQCSICEKSFVRKSYLKKHEIVHTTQKPFQCNICEKSFTTKWEMQHHQYIHTGKKPFRCKVCQNSFTRKADMKKHEIIHTGVKPFQCSFCKKSFTRKSNLKYHVNIHTREKPFPSNFSEKSKSKLKRHERIHQEALGETCEIPKQEAEAENTNPENEDTATHEHQSD